MKFVISTLIFVVPLAVLGEHDSPSIRSTKDSKFVTLDLSKQSQPDVTVDVEVLKTKFTRKLFYSGSQVVEVRDGHQLLWKTDPEYKKGCTYVLLHEEKDSFLGASVYFGSKTCSLGAVYFMLDKDKKTWKQLTEKEHFSSLATFHGHLGGLEKSTLDLKSDSGTDFKKLPLDYLELVLDTAVVVPSFGKNLFKSLLGGSVVLMLTNNQELLNVYTYKFEKTFYAAVFSVLESDSSVTYKHFKFVNNAWVESDEDSVRHSLSKLDNSNSKEKLNKGEVEKRIAEDSFSTLNIHLAALLLSLLTYALL